MEERKRQLKEQTAFHAYYSNKHPLPSKGELSEGGKNGTKSQEPSPLVMTARPRVRVVTTPETVQPAPWHVLADRRAQLRRRHVKPASHTVLVRRSLSQTDVSAPSRQMRGNQRAQLPQHNGSRVPVRSGRRKRKGAFIAKLLAFFTVLVIGVLGVNFALTSPSFRVQQVNVVGTQNPALISNIQHMGMQGQNIFLIDTAALAERIEMIPRVASASLGKQWPNSLTVTVVERTPVLLWQTKYGTYSIDRQAVVIAPASETVGTDHLMAVVDVRSQQVGVSGQPIRPGVRLNQADIAFALQVFVSLPQMTGISNFRLRYDAGSLRNLATLGEDGSFTIASPDGWIAYLGGANDANPLDNRLNELQQILALAQKQRLHIATIDLRFGLRPVYTLKKS